MPYLWPTEPSLNTVVYDRAKRSKRTRRNNKLKELVAKFENKQPEIVFEWKDSQTEAIGWGGD
jgi:hypothetical protein